MLYKRVLIFIGLLIFVFIGAAYGQTKFELDGNKLILPKQIIFESGSDKINLEESEDALKYVKEYLTSKKAITVLRIEVHGQPRGDEKSLQTLTEKRAFAVANWLVENGIDCKRILPVGFGSTKPIVNPTSGPQAGQNNRVEFHNAGLLGRAIGGMPLDGGGKVIEGFCKPEN